MTLRVTFQTYFKAINIPNLFTMFRIFLVPAFFLCLYYQLQGTESMSVWTRVILVLIILSDFFDGFLARLLKETSALGSVLDPLADKLFVLTSYIVLAVFQKLPPWLAIIVVSKDILVVTGWLLLIVLFHKIEVRPSYIGKTATAFQFFTVCCIIFFPESFLIEWFYDLTGLLTIGALIHYGFRLSFHDAEEV